MFHADLHIHSKFSRACSKDCDIPHLAWWALRKGITVVGTGDFTHPAWSQELARTLVPAEPGLLRLRPDLEARLRRESPGSCDRQVRFMLSVEISTIYRRDDRTRKVHHLLYAPGFEEAGRITAALSKIGNLASDGRPILGLDSRDLLEITLAGGPGCYLVPAHVWTPWFAVLGSKSGFDSVAECYADLADHVFAVETGLSSDPPMNWMVSGLDGYRLVSNSDAHSPPMLGREATTFDTDLDYFAMADALRTGNGLAGTLEFYPEEGKYHLDGHRKCGVRLEPEETRDYGGLCPKCDKPLTVGVLHRVAALADRPAGYTPTDAPSSTNLLRLPQIVGEIMSVGAQSKKVTAEVDRLVAALGPELDILSYVPHDEIIRVGGSVLGESIARLRRGEVIREAGYDGEYGTIRLMRPDELSSTATLFDLALPDLREKQNIPISERPGTRSARQPRPGRDETATKPSAAAGGPRRGQAAPAADPDGDPRPGQQVGDRLLDGLDTEQRAAATATGPLLILAGPGTGKTRTLTRRIGWLIATGQVAAEQCLAITFTRHAAQEMRDRFAALSVPQARQVTVTTFHGLGLQILRENTGLAGLDPGFGVADEAASLAAATGLAGSASAGRRLATRARRDPAARAELRGALTARGLVDFDSLVELPAALLRREPAVAAALRERWPCVSVDEYQDIDATQYDLLHQLCAPVVPVAGLTVIGDPDQAIYGFRGSDVGFFLRFSEDFPGAATARLETNYRSAPDIVAGALQAVAPASLVPGRELRAAIAPAARAQPPAVLLHEAADEQAEADWIAAEMDRLLGGASFHSLDSGRADGQGHGSLGLADVAVLYRTDSQAKLLTQAFTRAGLPFQKRSHDRLAHRAGVPDLIREMSLTATEATSSSPAAGGLVRERLRAAVRKLTAWASPRVATDIQAAGEVLGPLADLCGDDLDHFLTEIAVGAEADALDDRAEAVPLLTIHAAKGLEFDVVFLAGCERGLLPLWLPGTEADEAEERRLLFVAMTRARSRLLMSCAATRTRQGATRPAGPSPFLAAIDPGLLARPAPAAPRARPDRQLRLL
jgi:DNA helicase II / ATP-dependent DNA helicase PcrA